MLFAMAEHLELPRPWRLMLTAGWNLAESLGIPVVGYVIGATLGGRGVVMLQVPLANRGLCVLVARTAPTRKPLVAQLAAEVVALRHPSHHAGLHRFFQGATWLWAGIFAVSTLG